MPTARNAKHPTGGDGGRGDAGLRDARKEAADRLIRGLVAVREFQKGFEDPPVEVDRLGTAEGRLPAQNEVLKRNE